MKTTPKIGSELGQVEQQIWKILLSDEYFIKNKKAITTVDSETFQQRYDLLCEHFVEIKGESKEKDMINSLFKKYNYKSNVYIFQGDFIKGVKQAGVHDFGDKTIFIISKTLCKSFSEHDLFPIIAHEVGHLINKTPFTPPFKFFFDKLISEKSTENEKQLFVLASVLSHIAEYRADCFALENTEQFEHVVNSFLKLERINNKKYPELDIYKTLADFIKLRKKRNYDLVREELIDDHPLFISRIYCLFMEAKKNKYIYSKSIQELDYPISINSFLEIDNIISTGTKTK